MSLITRKSLATRIKVGYLTSIAIDHPWANQNNVDLTPIEFKRGLPILLLLLLCLYEAFAWPIGCRTRFVSLAKTLDP